MIHQSLDLVKLKTLCLHWKKTYGDKTRQDSYLREVLLFLKSHDSLTMLPNIKSRDLLKKSDLHFRKTNDHQTWQNGDLTEEVKITNA